MFLFLAYSKPMAEPQSTFDFPEHPYMLSTRGRE